MLLLWFHRCIYRRGTSINPASVHTGQLAYYIVAHLFHPLRWRRLPLGLCDPWPPLRPRPWILHRLPQLLRLDIRSRLYRFHSLKRSGADVRRFPPGPDHQAMARLRRLHSNNLVLLRACHFWEPITAIVEPDWVVSCNCWRNRNHYRSRCHAQGACSQLRYMGRLQPE